MYCVESTNLVRKSLKLEVIKSCSLIKRKSWLEEGDDDVALPFVDLRMVFKIQIKEIKHSSRVFECVSDLVGVVPSLTNETKKNKIWWSTSGNNL